MELYARIIQEFAAPLMATDNIEERKANLRIAQIAWNFAIAEKYDMPAIEKIHDTIGSIIDKDPHLQETFRMLSKRKDVEFDAYNNYIIEISGGESGENKDEITVRHFNPGRYVGVGTLSRPALISVQNEDLAIGIVAAAAQKQWQVMVEEKENLPPDTFELDLLQSGLIPGPEFTDVPAKNDLCTCGSGKVYKKCCGK